METEIKFNKYQKRGAYHWQQVSRNPFRFNAFVAARYQQVINALPVKDGLKTLDVGCGDGVLLSMIAKNKTAQLKGIDTDADSLMAAKQKLAKFGDRVTLVDGSGYALPFKDESFDAVITAEVIEHLQYTDSLLAEIKRVLKKEGQIVITTPVKLSDQPEDKLHVQEFTSDELEQRLKKYFTRVRVDTSHPLWLKKFYQVRFGRLGHFYFEPFRWLINIWVLLTGFNPFFLSIGKNTNQIAVGYK